MNGAKKYLKLFTSCFYISAFTFGGGFVIIPLMRRKFVEDLKWLEESEMMDLTAIAQSSPGAIAVNAAILTGYKVGGILGAAVAVLATILPPMLIITAISFFYEAFRENEIVAAVLKGMQAGVAAVICDVVLKMGGGVFKEKNALYITLMAVAFVLTFFLNVNAAYIVLGSIALAVTVLSVKYCIVKKKKAKNAAVSAENSVKTQEEASEKNEELAERNDAREKNEESEDSSEELINTTDEKGPADRADEEEKR